MRWHSHPAATGAQRCANALNTIGARSSTPAAHHAHGVGSSPIR
ncbi:hypothetical protein [Canibacter zhuwentaonis]|nr:hypothetical protein [Canibacter zhuwentaonis]